MDLKSIRRLNVLCIALLVGGLLTVFSSFPLYGITNSEPLGIVAFSTGWAAMLACLLLTFVVDRVKCPRCGKPLNRPEYRLWIVRHFAKTQPSWSCVHCGHGGEDE